MAGALIALTGVLVATSLFNTANSGLPVFYASVLIPLLSGIHPNSSFLVARVCHLEMRVYFTVALQTAALFCVTLIQMIWFSLEADSEIVHLVSRIMFLVYFVICVRYVRGEVAWSAMLWTRRLLIAVFLYGAYQLPAKLLGWPLFLDWLRNNKSYSLYGYDAAGWTSMVRSTGIFAEPAQATVPVVVAILLNLYIPVKPISKWIGWLSITLFGLTSASRGMWLTIGGLALGYNFSRVKPLGRWLNSYRLTQVSLIVLTALLFPCWAIFASSNSDADLSQQERSGSVVLGMYMIRDSPVIGFGWNSASTLSNDYLRDIALPNAVNIEGEFIQNMVVSYWQQAGLAGLVLAVLPLILVWRWSTAEAGLKWGTLCSFLVAGGVGDFGYVSLTWLWMALLINVSTIRHPAADRLKANASSFGAGRDLPSFASTPTGFLSNVKEETC